MTEIETDMATWVEGKTATTPKNTLSDVNEIVNDTKSPWTRVSPLSDASNKTLEPVTPVSPHLFGNDGKLNYNLGSVTKPVAGPKPRLTAKPFSLEKSAVPYTSLGTAQAPLTPPKPLSVTSALTSSGKLASDTDNVKVSFRNTEAKHATSGTVLSASSSFAQKSSVESDGKSWLRASNYQDGDTMPNLTSTATPKTNNMAVSSSTATSNSEKSAEEKSECSETKPTTVVILETSVQKLKSKKSSDRINDAEMCRDSSQDQDSQGTPQSFKVSKSSIRSRKYSPSATQGFDTPKPASLSRATSLGCLGKWDQVTEEGKDRMDKEKDSTENPSSPRLHLKKPGPISTWLPETTDDQKSDSTIKQDEKPFSVEKPWLKKPRPLSMDLTARFETSAHKRNSPPSVDMKENVPIIKANSAVSSDTSHCAGVEQEESATVAEKCQASASPNDHEDKANSCTLLAKNKFDKSPKMDMSEKNIKALPLCDRNSKEKITSVERKITWESDPTDITVGQEKEEKEGKIFTTSLNTEKEKLEPDHEQFTTWQDKELNKECSDLKQTSKDEISPLGSDDRGSRENKISGGIIKRCINLLLDSAGGNTAKTDCLQSTTEIEKIDVPVRQRIQNFTSENNESKQDILQGSQRQSFKPRPLSSNITKRFESRVVGDEGHHEKQMDMTASSSPEHSILQNPQEHGGRESLGKAIEDQTDERKNEEHLMDTATEFRWSRRQSVKKVSQAFDNLATGETHSQKMSRRNTFNRKDKVMERQINDSSESASITSMPKVGTTSMDTDLCIKTVRVSVLENEIQRHKVPEGLHSEEPIQSFNKSKRLDQVAQPELKNYTTLKITSEVMCNDTETNKTKLFELEATALGEQRKTHFKSGEENISRFSVNAPPSSKVAAKTISGLLLPTAKIDAWQDTNEKAVSALPSTTEGKVTTHRTRKSHSVMSQTKLEGDVSGARGYWNRTLPAENSSTLEIPPTAPNSETKVAEALNTIQHQSSPIELRTTGVDSDKGGKKNIKKIQHNSHQNTEPVLLSKDSFTEFGLKKDNEATNQEYLSSAGSVDVKDAKDRNDVKGCKGARKLQQDGGTKEFSGKVHLKEGRDKRKKKMYLEPNPKSSPSDHISDCSPGPSYSKHRYTSELLPVPDSQLVDRVKDVSPEENLKSHPKSFAPDKPKTTLLTDAFLDMPWTNGESNSSKTSHVTASTKDPKIAEFEKLRKNKVTSRRSRHTILDLDSLMAEWGKEMTKSENEESRFSLCHDKKYNDHSSPLVNSPYVSSPYDEQSSKKMTKSINQDTEILSSSDKNKDIAEMLNKKHPQRNSVLDIDALMVQYRNRKPVDLAQESGFSKRNEGKSPIVKIQKSLSFTSREAKTYKKTDRITDHCDEEIKKDVYDGMPANVKRPSKDERWKSTPSLVYNEYDKLENSDLGSNDQKSEGKRIHEVDTLTSTPVSLNRWPKHDKKKSRSSSTYIKHGEMEQAEALTDGLKSDSREKGKLRERDQSGPKPRHRKNRSEERKLEITPIEKEGLPQVFDGNNSESKTGILDYLTRSKRLAHNSPHHILEKEKYVEMSVDDELGPTVGNRPAVRKGDSEQKSPQAKNEFSKDRKQLVPEHMMSRLLESCEQMQKAVDSLIMNQEGTSKFRGHEGKKSYSTGETRSRVSETVGSDSVEKEHPPAPPSKTQRRIGDVTQLTTKTRKQNEKKLYSRHSAHQETNQDPKVERVTQCCVSPSTKAKDTDALVQERDQFCSSDEREQYGTYEERGSSANEERDGYCKYLEHKQSQQENYQALSPCKEPSSILAASPRKEHVQSQASVSSQSEMTPSSEQPSFFQDPRNINYGLSSYELESPDDTDSLQSTDPSTQNCPPSQGFSFLEPVTTLDSCAQKSRIQLGRKTLRRAPTKHKKSGFGDQPDGTDQFLHRTDDSWMYKDSTESRPTVHEELIDEEVIRPQKLTISQCPRVAMFPGMDPSVLKASLRRNRAENDNEEDESSCEQRCRSCSPPAQQGLRVMPSTNNKGEGSDEMPPPWLQELKSKKRLSQHQPDKKNE